MTQQNDITNEISPNNGGTKATTPKVATPKTTKPKTSKPKTTTPERRKATSNAATPKMTTPRQRLLGKKGVNKDQFYIGAQQTFLLVN
ncbi:hypothetical protein C2G38_2235493 [Gigaspora rosea]|uniref:Uncharacterized protein n=1 Tax=Gigaspora rosea TaxID=44941 RepID=A0A397TQE7_9GLOM|nr:hypothetical protein C2G38_2235493 [Gigaspora rosea]